MRDVSTFVRWANSQQLSKIGRPLSRLRVAMYESAVKEFICVFESSEYESFDESFIAFYKIYLRKKHNRRSKKIAEKALIAQRFYEYRNYYTQAQLSISFSGSGNHRKS